MERETRQRLTARVKRGLARLRGFIKWDDLNTLKPRDRQDVDDAVAWMSDHADANAKHGKGSKP